MHTDLASTTKKTPFYIVGYADSGPRSAQTLPPVFWVEIRLSSQVRFSEPNHMPVRRFYPKPPNNVGMRTINLLIDNQNSLAYIQSELLNA